MLAAFSKSATNAGASVLLVGLELAMQGVGNQNVREVGVHPGEWARVLCCKYTPMRHRHARLTRIVCTMMTMPATTPPFFDSGDDFRLLVGWLTTGKTKWLQSLTRGRLHTMREYGPGLFSWAALQPFAETIDWPSRIVDAMTQAGKESSFSGWLSLDTHMPPSVAIEVGRSVVNTVLTMSRGPLDERPPPLLLLSMVETLGRVYSSELPGPVQQGWSTYSAEFLKVLGPFQRQSLLEKIQEPCSQGERAALRVMVQNMHPDWFGPKMYLDGFSIRALWEDDDFVALHTMLPWGTFALNEEQVKHWFPAVHAALSPMLFDHEWGNTELLQTMARTVMNPVLNEPAMSLPVLHL